MWTHRNTNNPGAAVQHIDYILATKQLCRELVEVTGGIRDFPGAWEVSDHAPVVADFA
jgi:exonuclease III